MQHGLVDFEDLDIFFNIDEFAVKADLQFVVETAESAPSGLIDSSDDRVVDSDSDAIVSDDATVIALEGIFETPYQKRDFGAFIVDAEAPSFTCKWQNQFVDVRKGDLLFVGEGSNKEQFYIDSAAQNDGTGVVAFILTPASTQDATGDDLDDTVDERPTGGGLFGPNPQA